MAGAALNPDNYIRVYRSLHLVVHEAIQCVDNAVKVWHGNQRQTLPTCTGQCPNGEKPRSPASCQNCVAWGKAVEEAFYQPPTDTASARPPELTWSNVTLSDLGKNHREAAKVFALRLPSKRTRVGSTGSQYTSMSDFDQESLLMIMTGFVGFHNGDQSSYDAIMKVSGIRNDLFRMRSHMFLDDPTMSRYLQDITAFVACLEDLHPQFFNTTKDVRDRLTEIQREPITAKMKEEIMFDMRCDNRTLNKIDESGFTQDQYLEIIKNVLTEATDIICDNLDPEILLRTMLAKGALTADDLTYIRAKITTGEKAEKMLSILQKKPSQSYDIFMETLLAVGRKDLHGLVKNIEQRHGHIKREEDFTKTPDAILRQCQEWLRFHYLESLCKIPLLPGDYDSYVDLDDIYTNVSLDINLTEQCRPVKMPLTSYDEMFTRKKRQGGFHRKLLLTGRAGSGKTTLSAKIAYDWAKQVEGSPLQDITLLFVLNMRGISRTSNIENIILNQLLPDDTTITEDQIRSMIETNADKVIIIFDAIDESDRDLYDKQETWGNIVKCLVGRYLPACRLLVTTRPWRIADIRRRCKTFTKVELSGFDKEHIKVYIRKFFIQDKSLGESLIVHLNQNPVTNELATVPLMTLLMCIYWRETKEKDLPRKIGPLFEAVMNILCDHYIEKHRESQTSSDDQDVDVDIKRLQCKMGKMALQGFWPPNNRIVFLPEEAESEGDVKMACHVGLITQKVNKASVLTRRKQTTLKFFHKACGEKCAGSFLASLAQDNPNELSSKLCLLKTVQDAQSVQLILQFACASSEAAADMVMKKLLDIYAAEVKPLILRYLNELLEFEETLQVQRFIDLCLRCNYEAGYNDRYNYLLKDIFPGGHVHFFGISAFTAVALGFYLTHSRPDPIWVVAVVMTALLQEEYLPTECGYIRSIRLRDQDTTMTYHPYRPLENVLTRAAGELKKIPTSVKQRICMEYIQKHPNTPLICRQMANTNPGLVLTFIQMWQACEGLPTARESNIGPIIDTMKHIHLQVFDISGVKIGDININHLLKTIDENHLSNLLELYVCKIGMHGNQMDLLGKGTMKMPHLQALDVSGPGNESNRGLSHLAESSSRTQSLKCIKASNLRTSTEDMAGFVNLFHRFGSQLRVLRIEGNYMNNRIASVFTEYLPIASALTECYVPVKGLSKTHHNELLLAIPHLSRLQELGITQSQYPDDMIVSVAEVLYSLPALGLLHLALQDVQQIKSTAYQKFRKSLQTMNRLKVLNLQLIALKKEDFTDLVSLCRRMQYQTVRYMENCLPDDVEVPKDNFFMLL